MLYIKDYLCRHLGYAGSSIESDSNKDISYYKTLSSNLVFSSWELFRNAGIFLTQSLPEKHFILCEMVYIAELLFINYFTWFFRSFWRIVLDSLNLFSKYTQFYYCYSFKLVPREFLKKKTQKFKRNKKVNKFKKISLSSYSEKMRWRRGWILVLYVQFHFN